MVSVYQAQKMTGRSQADMVTLAKKAKQVFNNYGIRVYDPVLEERVKSTKEILVDKPLSLLHDYWTRDKQMIRAANVVVDLTPEEKSEGVAHEIGYARYSLWKPIVRVYQASSKPASLIAVFEDDLIVHSLEEAAVQIHRYWGSWSKRVMWRISLYNRCLVRWVGYQIYEWLH